MKINTFPVSRFSAAALLAASLIGLPFTSQARPDPDSRRERPSGSPGRSSPAPSARPSVNRPSTPAPQRPAPSARPSTPSRPTPSVRPSTPQRPSVVTRPSVPQTRPTPSVRPSQPQRPSVVSRPDRPSVTRPSLPERPSVSRPTPSRRPEVVTRPALPSRPSVQRPDRDSDRNEIRRPEAPRRPSVSRPSHSVVTNRSKWHYHDSSRFSRIDRSFAYRSYPRHHYRLCHGNGYRGLGWYFGPPNVSYYYETPGVYYYSSRDYAPASYVNLSYSPASSLDYAVQDALADLGYYDGPIDGDIGPMSRLAIANYQADNGLEPTGIIDETLVSYLGIE